MKCHLRRLLLIGFLGSIFKCFYALSPVSAVSPHIVIYQVQTGGNGTGTSSQELILIKNTSLTDVNITNWCLQYSSSADNVGFKSCLGSTSQVELWLTAGELISFSSTEFISVNPLFVPDKIFSAGMASTGGHLRLLDANNNEIDKVGWGTAVHPETTAAPVHTSGKVLGRDDSALAIDTDNNSVDFLSIERLAVLSSGLYEVVVPVDLCPNIDDVQASLPDGMLQDEAGDCFSDVCPNLDELQKTIPDGYRIDNGVCTLIPLENRPLVITELYANAPSYDTGKEFIELYNPNDETVLLKGYVLQVGPDFDDDFTFKSGEIKPGAYIVVTDSETGIVLPNSSGVALRLKTPAGMLVSEAPLYPELADTESWAVVDDMWIVTNQVTRTGANKPYIQKAEEEVLGVTTVLAPCPAGKYRNPETRRCRTIETAVATLAPCDEDEYRSPETNRCRKLVSTTSSLKPCDEGEERNVETNRCRKVSIVASSQDELANVVDVPSQQTGGTINWPSMTAVVGLTGGYMLYEWRNEIRRKFRLH